MSNLHEKGLGLIHQPKGTEPVEKGEPAKRSQPEAGENGQGDWISAIESLARLGDQPVALKRFMKPRQQGEHAIWIQFKP
ncbi:MAG: hypothetical protein ACKOZT_02855 [Cyanobium sp.]